MVKQQCWDAEVRNVVDRMIELWPFQIVDRRIPIEGGALPGKCLESFLGLPTAHKSDRAGSISEELLCVAAMPKLAVRSLLKVHHINRRKNETLFGLSKASMENFAHETFA